MTADDDASFEPIKINTCIYRTRHLTTTKRRHIKKRENKDYGKQQQNNFDLFY